MTVTRSPLSQNLSVQVIQRCKQGDPAVSVVVVSASSHMALSQWQSGLGSFQGLALAFFITAKDDRSGWRIQVLSDEIPEFGLELGIVGELESMGSMGFEVVGRPDPLHPRTGETAMPSNGPANPPPASLGGTHHFVEQCLDSIDRNCFGSARREDSWRPASLRSRIR